MIELEMLQLTLLLLSLGCFVLGLAVERPIRHLPLLTVVLSTCGICSLLLDDPVDENVMLVLLPLVLVCLFSCFSWARKE